MYYLKYFCIFQSENRAKNIQSLKAEIEDFKMEKEQIYRQTTSQIKSLIYGVDNKVGALANVAAALKETFSYYFWVGFYIVKDIACSSKSRSEIVVPVFKDSDVVAVIDVDSANHNAFDDKDKEGLETIAKMIEPLF